MANYEELVKRRHPDYTTYVAHWDFLESTYEGGREWFQDNIFRYVKEGDQEHVDRKERAYRFNHTREIVDLVNKYLFRSRVSRSDGSPEFVKNFWESASKSGMGIDHFMPNLSKQASIFGRIYVVIDSSATGGTLTLADQAKEGARCYAYIVKPQNALDMSFDEMGDLNWILIREIWRDDADPFGDVTENQEQFRLWTRNEWFLFRFVSTEQDKTIVEMVEQGTHGLGQVPVIVVDHMEDDALYYSPALINDIAYLDRAVANYLSNLDAIIQDQTFSQLAMPAQALMPGEEDGIKQKLLELGTKRVFIYNGEGGAEPRFLSPDPRQAQLIITAIRQIINEIYHSVGVAGERTKQDNSMGIDNSSGVAKAYDFERVNALLVNKAKVLERAERDILKVVAAWNSRSSVSEADLDSWVQYSETFDVRGLMDEFDVAGRLQLIDAPRMVRQEQMKAVIAKLFPTLAEDLKRKMLEELESDWPADPLEEMEAFGPSTPGSQSGGSSSELQDDE